MGVADEIDVLSSQVSEDAPLQQVGEDQKKKKVVVEVISDLMWPWCWVGKRNLESAIRQTQHEVEVRWLPFLLRPAMPREGIPKKGKGLENVPPRLRQIGASVGIDFTGACDRVPNTVEMHALLAYAASVAPAKQSALQEVLFRHYFTDGLYPAGTNLSVAAEEVGLDGAAALAFAEDPKNQAQVVAEARRNSQTTSGVPFFRVNGEDAFSGAQPPAAILSLIEEAARD